MTTVAIDRFGFLTSHILSRKQACRVATTANITLNGIQSIDGVTVSPDDRVLVKNQTNTSQNGIYLAKTGDWELADDFDQRGHVVEGTRVFVTGGATNAITEWWVTTEGRPYPGRQEIAFDNVGMVLSATLQAISEVTPADGTFLVGNGSTWVGESGATARASLGVSIGSQVQGWDANLDQIAALTPSLGRVITGNGTSWVAAAGSASLLDLQSLESVFGAVGDGTTDDTSAITTADAATGAKFAPTGGVYDTTIAATDLDGPYWGFGQIRDSANHLRAPWFAAVKANKAYTQANEDSITTAFDGDFSLCLLPVEYRITGAATLTQPTSGYVYSPWATPHFTFLYNESGHNEGTADNTGRTAATAYRTRVHHVGQGDAVCYNATAIVNSTRSGSTSFLANPAVVLFNGDIKAAQAGCYLNAGEFLLDDDGNDVAGIGWVVNMDRSNDTGAKGCVWAGFRAQSIGSKDVNAFYSATGKCDVGLDFSHITTDAAFKCAIALKADDRLYGNTSSSNGFFASALGDEYLVFSSSLNAWNFVVDNTSVLQISATQVTAVQQFLATGAANMLRVVNSTDNASVQVARFEGDRATMADNDEAYVSMMLSNDGGTQTEFARQTWVAVDVNAGTSVDGRIDWAVVTAGTLADELSLTGTALFPSSSGGLDLGIASTNPFGNLFLSGNITAGQTITTGVGVSTGDAMIELGASRTGDGNVYIDMHATSGSDFESRVLRLGGANGAFSFTNTGTGAMTFEQGGAGLIAFSINGTTRYFLDAANGMPVWRPGSATPATLTNNGEITVTATSNTNLRFSHRGTDGTTRVANLTLA